MQLHRLAGIAALALIASVPAARANFVQNGSFETTTATTKQHFYGVVSNWSGGNDGGNNDLTFIDPPGTADNGQYLSVYSPFPNNSPDGGNFVEADGDPSYSSAIYQTIAGLTVGASYTLTFYQAAGQQQGFTGPTTEQWTVTFGTVSQVSTLMSLPGPGQSTPNYAPWQAQTMTFTASATSQVLKFLATGTPGGAPPISFLDGVDLERTAAVPEPSTLTLVGIAAAAVGLIAARRRRLRRS